MFTVVVILHIMLSVRCYLLYDAIQAGDAESVVSFMQTKQLPLHILATLDDYPACVNLIEAGINLELVDDSNATALFYAILQNNVRIVGLLLDNGADVNNVDIFGKTALHLAALHGHVDVAKILVMNGRTRINLTDDTGWSALHFAADGGHSNIVAVLIANESRGSTIELNYGMMPLHLAVIKGHVDVVENLMKGDGDMNKKNVLGMTALNYAAQMGHEKIFHFLLSRGADLCTRDLNGNTPLHHAVMDGGSRSLDIIKAIIMIKAETAGINTITSAVNKDGLKAEDLALLSGKNEAYRILRMESQILSRPLVNLEIMSTRPNFTHIKELLRSGAAHTSDADHLGRTALHLCITFGESQLQLALALITEGYSVMTADCAGNTALHLAAKHRNCGRVLTEAILKKCGDARRLANVGNVREYLPLHIACQSANEGAVRVLAPFTNLYARDHNKRTPLDVAARKGDADIVELLIDNGANPNTGSSYPGPLHLAALRGHANVVYTLLQRGASLLAIEESGNTAMHFAIFGGNLEVLKLLLRSCSSNTNIVDFYGNSLLHSAVYYKNSHHTREIIVKLLLSKGIYVDAKTRRGQTALYVAAMRGHMKTVRILLDAGANMFIKNARGKTCLHAAVTYDNYEIVEMLVNESVDLALVQDDLDETPLDKLFSYERAIHDKQVLEAFIKAGVQIPTETIKVALEIESLSFLNFLNELTEPITFHNYLERGISLYTSDCQHDADHNILPTKMMEEVGIFYALAADFYPQCAVLDVIYPQPTGSQQLICKKEEYRAAVKAFEASRDKQFYIKQLRYMVVEAFLQRREQFEGTYIDMLPQELIEEVLIEGVNRYNILGRIEFYANALMLSSDHRDEFENHPNMQSLQKEMSRLSHCVISNGYPNE